MQKEQFIKIAEWQKTTFGEATPLSKIAHLKEEIKELEHELRFHSQLDGYLENPEKHKVSKEMEFADCFLLLFGCAASDGMSYEDICRCIDEKMKINYKRKWGKPDANGVVKHIKSD